MTDVKKKVVPVMYGDEIEYETITEPITKPMKALSKIKSIKPTGTWDCGDKSRGDQGIYYKFWYIFEDGIEGTAMHETKQAKFKEGDEVEYEVKKDDPKYGKSLKVSKPQEGGESRSRGKYDPQKDAYWTEKLELDKERQKIEGAKQYIIIAQSCQAHAVSLYPYIWGGLSEASSELEVASRIESLSKKLYDQVITIGGEKYQEAIKK